MSAWRDIATAPEGYDGRKFNRVLFLGHSKAKSFAERVCVSGWMNNDREPVHSYGYKLIITHWQPEPTPPEDGA